jgi:DNA-binding NtrC family response regulator
MRAKKDMQMLMDPRGAAAMSGSTYDDDSRYMGDPPPLLNAEFEADVQCAQTSTSPVLITAPPQVAADVARRIHRNGVNRRGSFLALECSRLQMPEQLVAGFESASSGGTVLLRDVDRLSPELQAVLYARIVPFGVRVIAATSVSLVCLAAEGVFDERLFYRLNQIHLVAPNSEDHTGAA